MWLKDLLNPLLIGLILALFLNVPLGVIERHLFPKHPTSRKTKMRRPPCDPAFIYFGDRVFVGVAFLVIPELIDAVSIVISSLTNGLDQLVAFESTADYSKIPFGEQLSQIDIDFLELKDNLNEWLNQLGTTIMDTAASAFGSVVATAVDFAIGLVFSIYIWPIRRN